MLYVEPVADDSNMLTTNTARTTLLLNADKLPWDNWAYEFRSKMPKQLADFVSEKAAGSGKDHALNIRDRLKSVMDLFKVSRYRPTPTGAYVSDDTSTVSAGQPSFADGGADWAAKVGSDSGSVVKPKRESDGGNIYHLFEKKDGVPSGKTLTDPFPKVIWASKKNGLRTADDGMEDKAATFVRNQSTLLINADFRVFTDMIGKLCKEKDGGTGLILKEVVEETVHQWFEQALVETVIGIQQLSGSKEWGRDELERALSPEALTCSVMQRYHIYIACKRELGSKLGRHPATS